MPRKDRYHDCVRNALVKDGWSITHDPLIYPFRMTEVYVDLGAEAQIGAEREGHKIAVEIKMFGGLSSVHDLENALGQYRLYRYVIARQEPERVCYLAITNAIYTNNFADAEAQDLIHFEDLHLLVFDPVEEIIEQWIPR